MARKFRRTSGSWILIGALFHAATVLAAHPLITDDTGTGGRGGAQIEFNGMLGYDKERGSMEKSHGMITTLTYGLGGNTDLVLGIPYLRSSLRDDTGTSKNSGLGDVALELKWRFYQFDGYSLAFKPGLSFPTGNYEKGLGTGRTTYNSFLIFTREIPPWSFHANIGYGRNENKISERKDVWHVSLASEVEIFQGLKLVGNIGIERNRDRTANIHPAFAIGGFVYSLSRNVDVNFGIQLGITTTETDFTIHPGITYRFTLQ